MSMVFLFCIHAQHPLSTFLTTKQNILQHQSHIFAILRYLRMVFYTNKYHFEKFDQFRYLWLVAAAVWCMIHNLCIYLFAIKIKTSNKKNKKTTEPKPSKIWNFIIYLYLYANIVYAAAEGWGMVCMSRFLQIISI